MRVITYKIEHKHIGSAEESKIMHWEFSFDENDIPNPKMLDRFKRTEVFQTQWKTRTYHGSNVHTYYRSWRTNGFCRDTEDKQKREIVKIIDKYIIDNATPLVPEYKLEDVENP